jgi:flagellar basal-body rod protein FlgB
MAATIFDTTMRGLADALTIHQKRHQVLTSNLANVETPGFRAQDVDFASALKEAFQAKPAELEGFGPADPTPRKVEDTTAPARADGNTVDLDLQMAKLGMNGGRYTSLARILALRIGLLRQAIEGNR